MKKRLFILLAFSFLTVRGEDLSGVFGDSHSENHVPSDYKGTHFGDHPAGIPGKIEAEEYDIAPDAAPGISFSPECIPGHSPFRPAGDAVGIATYRDDSIDMEGKPEGAKQVFIGWTHEGEWLKYTVRVTETADYYIGGKFAATSNQCAVSFSFSPEIHTQPIIIPTTQGVKTEVSAFHTWEKLDHMTSIHLEKGTYVMTVKIESHAGLNLDYFTFTKKD